MLIIQMLQFYDAYVHQGGTLHIMNTYGLAFLVQESTPHANQGEK